MKIRWPLLVVAACALLSLLVPPLRDTFLTQLHGDGYYRGWAHGPVPKMEPDFDPGEIDTENTTDPRVLAVTAASRDNGFGRSLDPLIKRHPNETWLLARRLQMSVEKMRLDRTGGELSDSKLKQNQAAKRPSPERLNVKPNFTPADLEKCIALAKQGQKLEPDNAFWDWMLVYFLLSGWRDEEAWPFLESGSHKAHFNMHQSDWLLAERATREAFYGRQQTPEASLGERIYTHNMPSYGPQREMARIIVWQGVKAQRRGDHQKALRIFTDTARMHYTAEREAFQYMDALVYRAMALVALGRAGQRDVNASKRLPASDPARNEKLARIRAQQVETYAQAHGRPDLGREMSALTLQSGKNQDDLKRISQTMQFHMGLNARPVIRSVSLWWAASIILLLLPMLALWSLFIGMALRAASVPIVEHSRGEIARPAASAALLMALLLIGAFLLGVGWRVPLFIDFNNTAPYLVGLGFALLVLALLWPVPFASWLVRRRARKQAHESSNSLQEAVPRGWRERLVAWRRRFRLVAFLQVGGLNILALVSALWWLITMASQGADSGLFDTEELDRIFSVAPYWPQSLFFLSLLLLWLRDIFVPDKMHAAYKLRLWHATLSGLLAVASVSYLLLLTLYIPVRTQADAAITDYIQRGEVAAMLQHSKR